MKTVIATLVLICTFFSGAQSVKGELLINKSSNLEVELKHGNSVELFKDFKVGNYQIQFNFNANDCPLDEQKRQIVRFQFETEIFQNNKKIASVKRQPLPFFPGEMLEPVEAFDIVSLLTQLSLKQDYNYPGQLKSGLYKIVIKAKPLDAKGEIKSASVVIFI